MYNEVLPPMVEEQKILEANESLVYQLLELMQKTSDGMSKTYRWTKIKSSIRLCFQKSLSRFSWKI